MGLDPATTRHYRVSAINAVGTSNASDSDDTTTASTNNGRADHRRRRTARRTDHVIYTARRTSPRRGTRAAETLTAGAKNPETLTSAATATTPLPGAPTITGTAQVGQTLTAGTTAIMDADGLTSVSYTYQWIRVATDNTETNISSATASTYTLVAADQGTTVKVTVSFTDDANNPETLTSAATATVSAAANTLATGAPTITGTAQVGQTLTASTTGIADANGLTSPTYTYQWIRVDGTDEADIASANSSTYPLGAADLGTTLKVRVTFADDLGHTETLTSAATATVGAVATAPTVSNVAVTSRPASGTTYYLAGEAIEFTVTFSAPVTVTATPKFAFRLGAATRQAAYASGSDSAALVFARTVQAGEVDRNGISWNALALALDGGTITRTGATTAAILTHAEQAPLEGHRVDAALPMQVSASVHGLSLVLVYDEALDPASMPATGAYTVTATVGATTTNPEVSEVSIYGIWVTLALDAPPAAGATVTLAYAPPASNPVQDEAGNDAPAFSGQKVNGAAGNTAATGAPTITGTAEVGQTLTAVTTGIMDADGLTSPTYTYQWIRVDGTEAAIAAANSSTYTLVDADLGTTLKVRVSFDDDLGHTETLTSAATATVGAAATAPTVNTVEITSRPERNATYAAGKEIAVTVTFSETVVVTGTPRLNLNVGGVNRPAAYRSGTGAAAVFIYMVADGESDTDGMSIEANSLTLNGGRIRDGANNNALLTHDGLAADAGHKVDGIKPALVANGGAVVNGATLTLTYGEALDVSSTPLALAFTVNIEGAERTVSRVAVSGSAVTLTLDPEVGVGQAVQLTYRVPGANLIQDTVGNAARAITNRTVENNTRDTTAPSVSAVAITSDPGPDGIYAEEDVIEITVTFSETVTVDTTNGTPSLALTVGRQSQPALYSRPGTASVTQTFNYTVGDSDIDTDGVSIAAGRIALNGGTIQDLADNPSLLVYEAVPPQPGHTVDGVRPVLQGATVRGATLTLTYGEALDGGSTPAVSDFTVNVAGIKRPHTEILVSGSTVTLTLDSPVTPGETVTVSYKAGTDPIQDAAGNAAEDLTEYTVGSPGGGGGGRRWRRWWWWWWWRRADDQHGSGDHDSGAV